MSDIIIIRRKHGKTRSEARIAAEHMASELEEEFDLSFTWDGEVMHFKRPGLSGELTLDNQEVILNVRLGFFLSALKPSIESEVHRFFDENFRA
jgi:putative polyhydroxyalkanoate system protein